MAANLEHRDWPVCPHCGHAHPGAWEWDFGAGLEGEGEFACASCGGRMRVTRCVTVSYTTAPVGGSQRAVRVDDQASSGNAGGRQEKDAAGFPQAAPVVGERFRQPRDTREQKVAKAMLKRVHSVGTLAEASAARQRREPGFKGMDTTGFLAERTPAERLAPQGTPLEVARRRVVSKPLSPVAAARKLGERGLAMSRERFAWLEAHYPNGVPEAALDEVAGRLSNEVPA